MIWQAALQDCPTSSFSVIVTFAPSRLKIHSFKHQKEKHVLNSQRCRPGQPSGSKQRLRLQGLCQPKATATFWYFTNCNHQQLGRYPTLEWQVPSYFVIPSHILTCCKKTSVTGAQNISECSYAVQRLISWTVCIHTSVTLKICNILWALGQKPTVPSWNI